MTAIKPNLAGGSRVKDKDFAMKKVALALVAVAALGLWSAPPAEAQSCCRGGAYTGAGSNPTPGVPRHAATGTPAVELCASKLCAGKP